MPIARLAVAVSIFSFTSSASAVDGVLTGSPDPAIIAAPDGQTGYYVFATGRGTAVWHSDDLVTWRHVGRVFDEAVPAWARKAVPGAKGIWAPDISFHDGLYLGSATSVACFVVSYFFETRYVMVVACRECRI